MGMSPSSPPLALPTSRPARRALPLFRLLAPIGAVLAAACASGPRPPPASQPGPVASSPGAPDPEATLDRPGWTLAWHDEFDGPTLDGSRWVPDQGGLWPNGELQFYTARPENVRIEDGHLILEARAEEYFGNDYTSARLKTLGKASFRYGRIEARMQVPAGQGLWPAFWLLGETFPTEGWPGCGEIDVVEIIGREPARAHGTVHGSSFHGAAGISAAYTLPRGVFADAEHVFAVEWEPGEIRWYVDGTRYQTVTPRDLPRPEEWPFDRPFFLIVNLAVGGTWPGDPDATTPFPARLRVDWVRVYRR
jgi:beta-glucanase (GH16 family)